MDRRSSFHFFRRRATNLLARIVLRSTWTLPSGSMASVPVASVPRSSMASRRLSASRPISGTRASPRRWNPAMPHMSDVLSVVVVLAEDLDQPCPLQLTEQLVRRSVEVDDGAAPPLRSLGEDLPEGVLRPVP